MKTASVLVNWGSPADTIEAMRSLTRMTDRPDLIICVDNGTPADDLERLRSGMPDGAVLLELAQNVGVAAANNIGIEYAIADGADWVLLLNNDATVDSKCLERCIAEATVLPRVALLGPAVRFAEQPDLLWFAGGEVSDWFAYPRHRALLKPATSPPPSSDVGYVSTCCAVLSSEAFRAIGPFREDFFMYYDETEWCVRARAAGWRCRYLGEVLCTHAVSASGGRRGSLGLSENMAYYLARNPMRFALDTPEPLRRVARVVGLLSVYGSFNAWRSLKAARWAIASAYLEGLSDAFRGRMGKRPSR